MNRKKSFLEGVDAGEINPATPFFSQAEEAAPAKDRGTAPLQETDELPKRKERPKMEYKTKRVQLTMKPSTFEGIRAAATGRGLSFNEYMNQLAEKALERERARKA